MCRWICVIIMGVITSTGFASPVVVLTTSKAEEDILKTYNLHANCYITKPVDFDQFVIVVRLVEDFWFTVVKLPGSEGTDP